ncbi:hypothetical protein BJ875DRAFT_108564 [Amylocarpus encephaloides]|uniref:DUF924 domain-containing protein n=1 Tax=Amylocarpus encephaloides TaxID=45428 RepID=A0A9P7YQK3_9HELO|nr:hypothetical protein BJ875DRAFT_108564 [Amylocarpus encephaloides]
MRSYNITSVIHKALGFQAVFKSSFQPNTYRAMSSISTPKPEVDRVLNYWFETGRTDKGKWFMGGEKVDTEVREQFGDLVDKARASDLTSWTQEPKGTLALIILLDQFSRNLFRGSPLSHTHDSMTLGIATRAIAQGWDQEVPHLQQQFFYLPLMHDENLVSQVAALALYDNYVARCLDKDEVENLALARTFCKQHLDTILRFGRYPSRNKILGREHTAEEIEFLKENPRGFVS